MWAGDNAAPWWSIPTAALNGHNVFRSGCPSYFKKVGLEFILDNVD